MPVPLPVSVSTDGFEAWHDAVRRAENGETVAVIAYGKHVADMVPSGELERLRETIEVLSDPDAVQALADTEPVVLGRDPRLGRRALAGVTAIRLRMALGGTLGTAIRLRMAAGWSYTAALRSQNVTGDAARAGHDVTASRCGH